jgi:hypothetical protein
LGIIFYEFWNHYKTSWFEIFMNSEIITKLNTPLWPYSPKVQSAIGVGGGGGVRRVECAQRGDWLHWDMEFEIKT